MKRTVFIATLIAISTVSLTCRRSTSTSEQTTLQQRQRIAAPAETPLPVIATGYVTDTANVIDEASRKQLETTLSTLKDRKKIDFVVVTVPSTGSTSARDYSLAVAREHKARSADSNVIAGLLLLVAVDDRNWHIQISRNLEDDLSNDLLTKLSEPMTDSFRQKRYGEGVIKYVNALIEKLNDIKSID
jgi:uncharacterized membrane protein YgcG